MIIDRIEGGFAVVETDGGMADIPLDMLPDDVREGDVIREEDGSYVVDADETARLRQAAADRLKRLMRRNND